MEELRRCTICDQERRLSLFGTRKSTGKKYWQCNLCKTKISMKWGNDNWKMKMITCAKKRAKVREQECSIDIEWINNNFPKNCPCCNILINSDKPNGRGKHISIRPSLDKVNPKIGYTKTNTRIICSKCNMIKNYGNIDDHKNIVNWFLCGCPQTIIEMNLYMNGDGI